MTDKHKVRKADTVHWREKKSYGAWSLHAWVETIVRLIEILSLFSSNKEALSLAFHSDWVRHRYKTWTESEIVLTRVFWQAHQMCAHFSKFSTCIHRPNAYISWFLICDHLPAPLLKATYGTACACISHWQHTGSRSNKTVTGHKNNPWLWWKSTFQQLVIIYVDSEFLDLIKRETNGKLLENEHTPVVAANGACTL